MPPKPVIVIDNEDKPTNIPTCEEIYKQCFVLGPQQTTSTNISGVRIDLEKTSAHDISNIWVKFQYHLPMSEARTHLYVSRYLRDHFTDPPVRVPRVYMAFTMGGWGYIVVEYIEGPTCDVADTPLIAAAVKTLVSIPSPEGSLKPGPVGGGIIQHTFFYDQFADFEYESVEELQDHVNGILRVTERPGHVDFSDEMAQQGLRLCVSDLHLRNFMKDNTNNDNDGSPGPTRIVAIDFGGYSFLPPSFFGCVLTMEILGQRIANIAFRGFPRTNVAALSRAAYAMVPYGGNDIGGRLWAMAASTGLTWDCLGVPRRLWSRRIPRLR